MIRTSAVAPADRAPSYYETTERGLILIPVEIAGKRTLALLDTGSTNSIIDATFADELGLQTTADGRSIGTSGSNLLGRSAENVSLTVIGSVVFTFDEVVVADLGALRSAGLSNVKAIIGMNVLQNMTIAVDPCSKRIRLGFAQSSPAPYPAPYRAVAMQKGANGEPQLKGQIGSEQVTLTIDTGQEGSLALQSSAWEQFVPADSVTITGQSLVGDNSVLTSRQTWIESLELAGETFTKVATSERRVPESWGHGSIGMGILKNYPFILNARAGAFWIAPSTNGGDGDTCD